MFSSRGTVRYEERGQGYRDVEKVGKHCSRGSSQGIQLCSFNLPYTTHTKHYNSHTADLSKQHHF